VKADENSRHRADAQPAFRLVSELRKMLNVLRPTLLARQ